MHETANFRRPTHYTVVWAHEPEENLQRTYTEPQIKLNKHTVKGEPEAQNDHNHVQIFSNYICIMYIYVKLIVALRQRL